MSAPDLQPVAIEGEAWPSRPAPPPIDTARRRLEAWSLVALGSGNMLRVGDLLYSWDTNPRELKNGALRGRVYAQPRGHLCHDAGGYEISVDGRVLKIPRALAGLLPGTEAAAIDDSPTNEGDDRAC